MRILEPVQPVQIFAEQEAHDQASKAATYQCDFSVDTQFQVDLTNQQMQRVLTEVRTLYFDLVDCANNVVIVFEATRQRITLRARSWGYVPVAAASAKMGFTVTGTSPDVFKFLLHNYDIQAIISEAPVATPGDINFTTSPVLLGRFSPGAGPGEQIPVLSPFVISATDIRVQAAAQFNVFGRRTAGAGAMEDCTRTQLNVPGIELANTFLALNTFSIASGNAVRITQTTAGSPSVLTDSAFVLEGLDSGVNGPVMAMYHNSATPAANDSSKLRFFFNNTTPAAVRFGSNDFVADVVTAGAESGHFSIGTTQAGTFSSRFNVGLGMYSVNATDPGANNFYASGTVRTGQFTVATLPAAATAGAGARAFITDGAAVPVWNAAAAGGGATPTPVFSTGAAWNNG